MTYAAAPSPVHALVPQILMGPRTTRAPYIPTERYHLAIAAAGAGLDHASSEVALALVDDENTDARYAHRVLVTDRRLLVRASDVALDVPYPVINDARAKSGMLLDDLEITAWGRVIQLSSMPDVPQLASFLQALLRVHPGYRVLPPRPLATPTAEDPTGGEGARRDIWSRDVRVLPLLGMAIEGCRQGWLPAELGADLVARAMLFDRTLAYGRGSREGWWTSPLGGPDVAHAFTRMLGEPWRVFQEGHARVLDFRLETKSNAGAVASTAVGLVALGLFGVGWVSTPGRSLSGVRLKIAPGHASTRFALYDENGARLSQEWTRFVCALFEILPRIEGRMLIQRAAFGWDVPAEQLDEVPVEALFEKVGDTIGPIDMKIFFPKPPPK